MSNFMFNYTYTCIYTIIQIIISKLYLFIYTLLSKNIKQDIDLDLHFSYKKDIMKIDKINNISILTYNIKQLLFWVLYHDIDKIIDYLLTKNTTIICLQEIFSDTSKNKIIKRMNSQYPFIIKKVNRKAFYGLGEDSGLMILSKLPFKKQDIVYSIFSESYHIDQCSNKGFVMIKLNHKGYRFNIVNTHLQSDYQNKLYTSIRKHQITTILKVIDKNIPTILVGDLNIKCFSPEFKSYSWKNYYHKKDEYTCPDEKAILDYIIPLYTKTLNIIQYNIDTHIHLSDHKPVICQLQFHK